MLATALLTIITLGLKWLVVTNTLAYNTAVFITAIIFDNTRVLRVFVSAINFQSGLTRPEPATKTMERSDKHVSLSMPSRYYDEQSFII